MQRRVPFTFSDISGECEVETDCFRVDDGRERRLGARVRVPRELRDRYPYNGSAYGFLQELRSVIFELGIVVFPDLPVNRTNHTLAQRAPNEHSYSQNPYLTDRCQSPHQDTPPYPTAFWLDAPRRFFATWVLSSTATEAFYRFQQTHPALDVEDVHPGAVQCSADELRGDDAFVGDEFGGGDPGARDDAFVDGAGEQTQSFATAAVRSADEAVGEGVGLVAGEADASGGGAREVDRFRNVEVELDDTRGGDFGVRMQQRTDARWVGDHLHGLVDRDRALEGHFDLLSEALPDHPHGVATVPGSGGATEAACDAGGVGAGFGLEGVSGV